ncbi:hypothetical protein J0H58_13330 [bacterium]|nr:hypothetical protein [bacterium]
MGLDLRRDPEWVDGSVIITEWQRPPGSKGYLADIALPSGPGPHRYDLDRTFLRGSGTKYIYYRDLDDGVYEAESAYRSSVTRRYYILVTGGQPRVFSTRKSVALDWLGILARVRHELIPETPWYVLEDWIGDHFTCSDTVRVALGAIAAQRQPSAPR